MLFPHSKDVSLNNMNTHMNRNGNDFTQVVKYININSST